MCVFYSAVRCQGWEIVFNGFVRFMGGRLFSSFGGYTGSGKGYPFWESFFIGSLHRQKQEMYLFSGTERLERSFFVSIFLLKGVFLHGGLQLMALWGFHRLFIPGGLVVFGLDIGI